MPTKLNFKSILLLQLFKATVVVVVEVVATMEAVIVEEAVSDNIDSHHQDKGDPQQEENAHFASLADSFSVQAHSLKDCFVLKDFQRKDLPGTLTQT